MTRPNWHVAVSLLFQTGTLLRESCLGGFGATYGRVLTDAISTTIPCLSLPPLGFPRLV